MNLIQSHRCWGEAGNDWVSSCLISSLLLQLALNRVLFSKFLWITIYYCLRLVQKPEIRLGIAVNSLNVEAGKYRPTTKFERPWIRVLLSQDVNIKIPILRRLLSMTQNIVSARNTKVEDKIYCRHGEENGNASRPVDHIDFVIRRIWTCEAKIWWTNTLHTISWTEAFCGVDTVLSQNSQQRWGNSNSIITAQHQWTSQRKQSNKLQILHYTQCQRPSVSEDDTKEKNSAKVFSLPSKA
jgi:hypothetical protein